MNKYEQTLSQFIPLKPEDWSSVQYALFNAAHECDRLTRRCADNAELLNKRFATYSEDIKKCYVWDPPTGSSLFYDITADHARLRMALEHLHVLLTHTMGPDVRKAYEKALGQ